MSDFPIAEQEQYTSKTNHFDSDSHHPVSNKPKDKRARVSSACLPCKLSRTKCSDSRPCSRCTSHGRAETCMSDEPKSTGRLKDFNVCIQFSLLVLFLATLAQLIRFLPADQFRPADQLRQFRPFLISHNRCFLEDQLSLLSLGQAAEPHRPLAGNRRPSALT